MSWDVQGCARMSGDALGCRDVRVCPEMSEDVQERPGIYGIVRNSQGVNEYSKGEPAVEGKFMLFAPVTLFGATNCGG